MIAMEIHCPQRLETTVRLINECKKLQELWVAFVMDMRSAKKLMDHAPESIRKLRLRVSKELGHHESVDQVSGVDAMNVSASMPFHSHPYLESLEISGNFQGWEEYLFLPFLTTCGTNLKDFRSRHTDCFRLKKLREDLFRAGASLEYLIPLQLPNYRSSSDSAVADTIVHHKRLHIIDLSYCNAAGPLTANAIVNCGKRLRSLRVPGCTKPSSKNLTSILGAASNMRHWVRHFVARTKAYDAAKDSYILARDLISTEWNAPFLVSFECRLKVPQPNEQARYGAVDQTMNHPSIRDCRAIQRAVYRQIARQKNLTHLDLGQSARCSLAMTLQSGLDELATLKKIRHLYVEYMNHWIGVPELEWMSNNWPQLDFICGPFKNGQNCDPAVIEWLMVNKPEWK
ncbi:hypothetical protein BG003_004041 [Podila horticola]|nr:hypothetical protein BG003_004041 [Podila horticola]